MSHSVPSGAWYATSSPRIITPLTRTPLLAWPYGANVGPANPCQLKNKRQNLSLIPSPLVPGLCLGSWGIEWQS